jgi:hypothetical protein
VCIVAAFVAFAASGSPSTAPQKAPALWQIRLDTRGGYGGSGKGWIEVASDGTAASEDCKAVTLADDALDKAVRAAQPEKWVGCYRRATFSGMTDQFSYQLRYRITRDGQRPIAYDISWQDDSAGMRPADLSAVAEAVWGAHKQLESRCGQ